MAYNILPGEGIEQLRFGADPDEAIALFGKPDNIDIDNDDDMRSEMWIYDEMDLILFFEGEEVRRLVCFESGDADTTLYGKKVFDMNEAALVALMKEHGVNEMEAEDEAWGERRLSFDDAMLDFYFEGGMLKTVNWGVIDEDEED
jgi:hypothetical protein